jgi:hypothetical protein
MILRPMPTYQLTHRHEPSECVAAFAAWHGYESPLRGTRAISSCLEGGHSLWWRVDTPNAEAALSLLPPFVRARSEAEEVREVAIP